VSFTDITLQRRRPHETTYIKALQLPHPSPPTRSACSRIGLASPCALVLVKQCQSQALSCRFCMEADSSPCRSRNPFSLTNHLMTPILPTFPASADSVWLHILLLENFAEQGRICRARAP
jgi:hypothetical protein